MKPLIIFASFLFVLATVNQAQAQVIITSCNSSDRDCYKEYRLTLKGLKNDLDGKPLYNQINHFFEVISPQLKLDNPVVGLTEPSWKRSFLFNNTSPNYHHYFKLSIVEADDMTFKNKFEPAQAYISIQMNIMKNVRDAKYTLSASNSKSLLERMAIPAGGLTFEGYVDFSGFSTKPKVLAKITFYVEPNGLVTIRSTCAFEKNSFLPKMPY